jgi:tetratricopeptide (TPR) repeat protein
METPALRPRGPTSTVPLPLMEVLRLAGEAEAAGRYEEAKRFLDYILAAEPNEPSALHLSGVVAFRLGNPEKALELMERSLALGIDTPLYLRNICEMYRVLGRLDEALYGKAGRRAGAERSPVPAEHRDHPFPSA